MNFFQANEPFAVSAAIIALGYLFKRAGVLEARDGETLAKVALNVTLPAIVLLNIPAVSLSGANATLPLYSLVGAILTVLLGFPLFRKQGDADRGLSFCGSSGYNIGLFAMPLVAGIYGSEGIVRFALIDIGNVIAVFVVSYYMAWRYSPIRGSSSGGWRDVANMFFHSIPFMAYILAVVMNIAGWQFSGFLRHVLEVPAAMNRGVALFTLGVLLRLRFDRKTWKAILPPLVLRYAFGVAAGAAVLFLFDIPLENRLAIAGVYIMPMGLTVIPFAIKWGYDRDRAAAIVNLGIPVSFILFWVVWVVGRGMAS